MDHAAANDTLSRDEAHAAVAGLSDTDLARLLVAAQRLCAGTAYAAKELLNEAVCRVLVGDRTCRRDLPVVATLVGAMKSIAWSARVAAKTDPVALGSVGADELPGVACRERTAEEALVATANHGEQLEALEALFTDDEEAFFVVMADADGVPAEQVRRDLGMSEAAYATVRRRIRRKINKAYPKGWTT